MLEFKQSRDAGCTLVSARFLVPKERLPVLNAINPHYEFDLTRRDSLASWAISRTEFISSGDSSSRDCTCNRALDYWAQHALLFIHTFDLLPFLVQQPEFSVKAVTPVTLGARQLARVEFDCRPKKTEGFISPLRTGWVLLDPERYWVIVKYEAELNTPGFWTGSIAGSVEYEEGEDVPIPKKRVQRQKRANTDGTEDEYEMRSEFQITEVEVPASEFYLSAFGLPEPTMAAAPPTRWYLWVALAAGVCLVLAVVLRWRAKRTSWTMSNANRM